jgi:hypothetical protein
VITKDLGAEPVDDVLVLAGEVRFPALRERGQALSRHAEFGGLADVRVP